MGAANSAQFWSMSAPMALCSSLAPLVDAEIARSRSTGSSRSLANDVNMADTWLLPMVSLASSDRTDTGHVAIKDLSGISSCFSR